MSARPSVARLIGACCILAPGILAADGPPEPAIEELVARRTERGASVSYRIANALGPETLDRIESGIPVRFRHRIEVRARRSVPLWPAKQLARTVIESRVGYDSLNQSYRLWRSVQVRTGRKKLDPPPLEDERTTESRDEMEAFLTTVEGVPLVDLEGRWPGRPLRVEVEVVVGRRYAFLIFPADLTVKAKLDLEP